MKLCSWPSGTYQKSTDLLYINIPDVIKTLRTVTNGNPTVTICSGSRFVALGADGYRQISSKASYSVYPAYSTITIENAGFTDITNEWNPVTPIYDLIFYISADL